MEQVNHSNIDWAEVVGPAVPFEKLPEILSVEEVGHYLRIGRNSAYDLVNGGGLKAIRVSPRHLRITKAALGEFLHRDAEIRVRPHAGKDYPTHEGLR
jgi:excisionase family DNA binding protein